MTYRVTYSSLAWAERLLLLIKIVSGQGDRADRAVRCRIWAELGGWDLSAGLGGRVGAVR